MGMRYYWLMIKTNTSPSFQDRSPGPAYASPPQSRDGAGLVAVEAGFNRLTTDFWGKFMGIYGDFMGFTLW